MRKIILSIGYLAIFLSIIFLYLDHQAGKVFFSELKVETFVVEKGDGLKKIAGNLEETSFIKDKNVFILYTVFRNLRKNFLPGEYQIKKNISIKEILDLLTTATPSEREVVFIEGWHNEQIADYLEKLGFFTKDEFLNKTKEILLFQENFEFLRNEEIKTLEGFIFPDTYRLPIEAKPESVLYRTLHNFNRRVGLDLRKEIENQEKTLYQILTLASIVEKEGVNKEDRETIAGIFWKRLAAGMALQADSTINYITGKSDRQARLRDLEIDSLYNTYKYRGLPPGPICNPGLESIRATIYAVESPYWYFLHTEDGTTIYSKDFEEHKKNKAKYLSDKDNFVRGELLVKYENDENIYKFYFDTEKDIEKIKKELFRNNKNIEIIEPNYIYQAVILPHDPGYQKQWFFEKINAPTAWEIVGGGSQEVVIALLDSGVDIDHPDLKENIWINHNETPDTGIDNDGNGYIDDVNGWDFVTNNNDPRPKFYPSYTVTGMHHGTVVAGLAGARGNNDQGVIGLAWNIKLMPIRVLDNKGEGTLEAVIKGVDYAIKNKADIINLSFVGSNPSDLLFRAIQRAWDSNMLIVAAAGNNAEHNGIDLDDNYLYPICLDVDHPENIIIGVTATDRTDQKASFANYGSQCIDIAAPGSRMQSTLFYYPRWREFNNYYGGYWSGTSVATPLVSASAALIKSLNPNISNREIRNILFKTATLIDHLEINKNYQGKLGVGLLNTGKAVEEMYRKMMAVPGPGFKYIVTAPNQGQPPLIRIIKPNGLKHSEFFAFDSRYRIGVSVATGDLNGDGRKEIIVGAGLGGGPQIRIFDNNGGLRGQFFAYQEDIRNGIKVTAGDINGNGRDEIIVGPETGNLPIRVFDYNGRLLTEFYAFDRNFQGGVSIATGDSNGSGIKEIIVGAGIGGGPQIRIFNRAGNLLSQFFAFNENFRGGINVAAGDLNRNGLDEIIVSIASGAGPYVRVFNSSFHLLSQFLAYDRNFYGGVSLATGDLNGDWRKEIITAPYKGGGPQIRVFSLDGLTIGQFFAYDRSFNQGLNPATIQKLD